jgi:tetratricopeptide (TPR) repeat protein
MNCKCKVLILSSIILLGCTLAYTQDTATTSKGKQVFLYSNGTWKYADGISQTETGNDQKTIDGTDKASLAANADSDAENPALKGVLPQTAVRKNQQIFTPELLITIGIAVCLLAGTLIFFLVIQPARKRKVYMKAIMILEKGDIEQYPQAIELLEKAVLSGLKSSIANEVFFALAFAKLQLDKNEEAFADIQKITSYDADSLYLKLYILYKKKAYKDLYEFFEEHFSSLESKKQSKEIVSIACIEIGKEKCKKQLHEQAIPYFAMVRKLKVYSSLIPESISNMQVTLGIQALYNKDIDQAVDLFTKARNKAIEEKQSTIDCDLGLVLCEWTINVNSNLEGKISEIVNLVQKFYNDIHAFEGKDLEDNKVQITEKHLLISNIYLLYGISYIYTWFQLPDRKGLPEEKIREIHERLGKALSFNPRQNDTDFILGLIDFYFNEKADKEESIKRIEKSNVNLPDIIQLIKSQKDSFEKIKKVIERYIMLAKGYIEDHKIPLEFRSELKERLLRYERFRKASELNNDREDNESETATLQEIQARSKITRKHINDILKNKFKGMSRETSENFSELINDLNETSEIISNSTKSLEKTEHLLMLNTGEYLLNEEITETKEE